MTWVFLFSEVVLMECHKAEARKVLARIRKMQPQSKRQLVGIATVVCVSGGAVVGEWAAQSDL
jgi:hypothetical protein